MQKKGFTLIELLIVVTIIGILAVALVPRIVGGSATSRDARRQTDVQSVVTGLEAYLSAVGDFSALGAAGGVVCSDDIAADLATYIGGMPSDPDATNATGAFNTDCTGEYAILFMQPSATDTNVTKYAVATLLELPEIGDDFVYDEGVEAAGPTQYDNFNAFVAAAPLDAASTDGYFIVY